MHKQQIYQKLSRDCAEKKDTLFCNLLKDNKLNCSGLISLSLCVYQQASRD